MVRKKSHLALNARYRDHVNVFGINGGLRRNNFQFDGIRHVSMPDAFKLFSVAGLNAI
jgi:hypothetical protein